LKKKIQQRIFFFLKNYLLQKIGDLSVHQ